MSFTDLFESGERASNLGHFASIANMATVNGKLSPEVEKLLKQFAVKLDIGEDGYEKILKDPTIYPINPPNSAERRLERMHDLFEIIFADNVIDSQERLLIEKYAIGLGYSTEQAQELIKKSVKIYTGGLSFDDYKYLLNRKN